MKSSLASRLGDIPGVASVVIDLDGFGRGIDVRLEPGADEEAVMERLRALLAAYGVKHTDEAEVTTEAMTSPMERSADTDFRPDVDVTISPLEGGARIEVATAAVKSFRVVAANPLSIAQGLMDAWCQVIGRVPLEVLDVDVDDADRLVVVAFDGSRRSRGVAEIGDSWFDALIGAIGGVLTDLGSDGLRRAAS